MSYSKYLILFCFALAPFALSAQNNNTPEEVDITGLWKGTIYNDSTKLYYQYEIGISKEKGKYTGFSHTWFILDDKQYYGVKKVAIRREKGKIIVQDVDLIANNYPIKPAKGVHQLNVLDLDAKDSIMKLSGPYTTNRTKDWAPVTGTVSLVRKNDYWQSSLVPHLSELGLVKKLNFVEDTFMLAKNTVIIAKREDKKSSIPLIKEAKANPVPMDNKIPASPPVTSNTITTTTFEAPKETTIEATPIKIVEEAPKEKIPAAEVEKRTTVAQQVVYFKSDSLQLSLYDNGEVDGDTVSVLMNGEVIMAKERLSTNAVRKTIQIDPKSDSVLLVMYAENLGSIAPNTGLLVVRDGKEIYEVRFSGDLQKNAAVIFRRKK